jgi:hypothetical protein
VYTLALLLSSQQPPLRLAAYFFYNYSPYPYPHEKYLPTLEEKRKEKTRMDASFDNDSNLLNAHIRINHDQSIIYSLKTTFGFRGRKVTVLKDENPIFLSDSNLSSLNELLLNPTSFGTGTGGGVAEEVVGQIYWREKVFEVSGVRKKVKEIRRVEGRFLKK